MLHFSTSTTNTFSAAAQKMPKGIFDSEDEDDTFFTPAKPSQPKAASVTTAPAAAKVVLR